MTITPALLLPTSRVAVRIKRDTRGGSPFKIQVAVDDFSASLRSYTGCSWIQAGV